MQPRTNTWYKTELGEYAFVDYYTGDVYKGKVEGYRATWDKTGKGLTAKYGDPDLIQLVEVVEPPPLRTFDVQLFKGRKIYTVQARTRHEAELKAYDRYIQDYDPNNPDTDRETEVIITERTERNGI